MGLVSEYEISQFEKNGVVCLRGIFDKKWIDLAARGIAKNLADPSPLCEDLQGETSPGKFFNDYNNWKRFPEFKEYAWHSPAAEVAGRLMKSEYAAFYHEHVLTKDPGSSRETPWHHDQSYYPIDGSKVCSIWMPVDYVPENTSLQFVAGSHKWDWYYPTKFETLLPYEIKNKQHDRVFHEVPNIEENKSNYTILKWELKPGDCLVFHMRTLHGAPGNLSELIPRRVLSTRWLGDDAKIVLRPWNHSPPTLGGLKPGDRAVSEDFPIIWKKP